MLECFLVCLLFDESVVNTFPTVVNSDQLIGSLIWIGLSQLLSL